MADSGDPYDPSLAAKMAQDDEVQRLARALSDKLDHYRYSYNFTWLGRPVIQLPQDLIALQELVWRTLPDLIVELGVAHGGLTVFLASLLELIGGDGKVVGVDIDIRPHNRAALDAHPLRRRIELIQGSSVDDDIVGRVRDLARDKQGVMIVFDSNHTHEHVLRELEQYSPLVRRGGYAVVLDTVVEHMTAEAHRDRPWGRGNNPLTAVREFLTTSKRFEIDKEIENTLVLTVAPSGYLRCIGD